jgi:hypothetical protein
MDLLLPDRGKGATTHLDSDQACHLRMLVRVAHEKGSRIYYSFARDVVPHFGEHELGYNESGRGLLKRK